MTDDRLKLYVESVLIWNSIDYPGRPMPYNQEAVIALCERYRKQLLDETAEDKN